MKKFLFLLFFAISFITIAQQKGTLKGLVTDKEANNEPLPFANVILKGTTTGGTTDFDGNYIFQVSEGTHTVIFSFLGYKTITKTFTIKAGQTLTINQSMSAAEGVGLDEVIVRTETTKEKESVLLKQQKEAVVIKESIGVARLDKIGISDAAVATTKISGVTKSEGSSSVFIRGLGDRYLSTTLNGLPIPSDDVDKKNISLGLFSTGILQNVSIAKTYAVNSYSDQSSGHVNIVSKQYSASNKNVKIGFSTGSNTNVLGNFGNFKSSPNLDDAFLGFHQSSEIRNQVSQQTWNPVELSTPLNYSFSVSGGKKLSDNLSLAFSLSNSKKNNYRDGIFNIIDENTIKSYYSEVEWFETEYNTTGLLDLMFRKGGNSVELVSLFVNKLSDDLVELGRNTQGYVFDQFPFEDGAFIRDQNTKQTRMLVNQLIGKHEISDKNTLNWAGGFNLVNADEPNRIRNEVNIGLGGQGNRFTGEKVDNTIPVGQVQFAHNSPFQSRKSSQEIFDIEFNGLVNDKIVFIDEENTEFIVNYGANFRNRTRDFKSFFVGVSGVRNQRVNSIDNIDQIINEDNFSNGLLSVTPSLPDVYDANLVIFAGYFDTTLRLNNTSINLGLRFEQDTYDLNWDVQNFIDLTVSPPVSRIGDLNDSYRNFLTSVNIKQQINDNNSVRFAFGNTVTLPEFKELAPFEYVTPTGRIIRGNPNLSPSTNYNFDLKWEMFPSTEELFSVTAFYKLIQDPINFSILPSAAGTFSYANTGESANIFGLELETKIDIFKLDDFGDFKFAGNFAYMNHTQDISANFQYKDITSSGLQGASDIVTNATFIFTNSNENGLEGSLSANYKSDNIFALGAPRDQSDRDINYNDQIIEKGLVTLDVVLSKKIGEHLSIKGTFKNLLNPTYKQTQNLGIIKKDETTGVNFIASEGNITIDSYKKGVNLTLGISYKF